MIYAIIAIIGIGYFVIKGKKRLKKYKDSVIVTNMIYQPMGIKYDVLSREAHILKNLNIERKNNKVKPLKSIRTIGNLAHQRALEAAESFSHKEGADETIKLIKQGADGVGELLSRGYFSGLGVSNGFMASERHRKALLDLRYDYCDIHSVYITKTMTYVDVVLLIDENTVK